MDHPFIQGGDPDKCVRCRRKELDHTDLANCEACPNIGPCEVHLGKVRFGDNFGLLLCESCMDKERLHNSPEQQAERAKNIRKNIVGLTKEIDFKVTTKVEYWNNETKSIGELADVIENDSSITNKRAALFEVIDARFKGYKQALIVKEEERTELMTKIRASYEYMVTLSNQLTTEERAKYQIADFNYKPVQQVSKPKPVKKESKWNKSDLIRVSGESGIPMPILQTLCVRFNCNVNEAVNRYKESMGIQ